MCSSDLKKCANHVKSYGEKTCLLPFANTKGVDQPAILSSLIRTFVVRCFVSIVHVVVKFRISGL